MKKLVTFLKLSLRYWRAHAKRLVTLAAVCALGAAALCFSCLYVRSAKAVLLEKLLNVQGDYDIVFCGMEESDLSRISENEAVTSYGFYRELGYVGMEGGAQYKAACFPDENSERMYHMTCTQGNYPQKEDEIAIDADTAKKMGIPPVVGRKITLELYDLDQQKQAEREYTISGIFESSAPDVAGGFYRYIDFVEDYKMPVVFFSEGEKELFQSTLITTFVQAESDPASLSVQLGQSGFQRLDGYKTVYGRTSAYSEILGISGSLYNEYGGSVFKLGAALKEGNVWGDFYSSVLIPLFAGLILVIVMVSIFSLVRDIIAGRAREAAILRSIGMTGQGMFVYLFVELMVLIGSFLLVGMLAGSAMHYLLVKGMNAFGVTDIPLGFSVHPFVEAVTPQPWLYALTVIGISGAAAVIVPLMKMARSTPLSVFRMKEQGRKRRAERHYSEFSKCTWRTMLSRHIRLHDRTVLVIMCVIMSAAYFGYN